MICALLRLVAGRVAEPTATILETGLDAGGRTWTMPQLVAWLAQEHGVTVHPDHLRRRLHDRGFGWKRTVSSVTHKRRDPDGYAATVAELAALKKRRQVA